MQEEEPGQKVHCQLGKLRQEVQWDRVERSDQVSRLLPVRIDAELGSALYR